MQAKRSSTALIATLAMFTVTLLATSTRAVAQKEKVLYSFNGADGAYPQASLILDNAGNLNRIVDLIRKIDFGDKK